MGSRTPQQLFWFLQVGAWLLIVPVSATMSYLVFTDGSMVFLFSIVRQVFGFGLTLGLWWFYRRWPADNFKLSRHAGQIILACLSAAIADVALTDAWIRVFDLPSLPPLVERGSFFARLALYIAWTALYFAIRAELESRSQELRLARAEAENRESELHLLRAQVNPHFLLNALNTIIAEAEHNPSAVIKTTYAVADYLRYSLGQRTHRAPLGAELEAMAQYLAIEEAHYRKHGLDWKIEADDEARNALAPTALVQPLVENAIKYGIRSSPSPLRLRVRAAVREGMLEVSVENSGAWVERKPGEVARDSTGIGLNNVRRRLILLCGDRAALEVSQPPGLVRVEARLPHEPAPVA